MLMLCQENLKFRKTETQIDIMTLPLFLGLEVQIDVNSEK